MCCCLLPLVREKAQPREFLLPISIGWKGLSPLTCSCLASVEIPMLRALEAVLEQSEISSNCVNLSDLEDCGRLLTKSGVYGRALEQLIATDVGVGPASLSVLRTGAHIHCLLMLQGHIHGTCSRISGRAPCAAALAALTTGFLQGCVKDPQRALALKTHGNEQFAVGKYALAARAYSGGASSTIICSTWGQGPMWGSCPWQKPQAAPPFFGMCVTHIMPA